MFYEILSKVKGKFCSNDYYFKNKRLLILLKTLSK